MKKPTETTLAEEREQMYAFFAAICLHPPSEALVEMIKDGRILETFATDDGGNGYHELQQCVHEATGIPELMNDLTAEFTKLFKLPADVIPQEAFYLDKRKRMGGRVTQAVSDFYKSAKAEIMDDCVEMADHIGVELQFMQFLCGLEKELHRKDETLKLEQCLRLQRDFLNEHLLQWIDQCCEKIIAVTGMRFYKAMAHLMMAFMADERQNIAALSAQTKSNGEKS